MKPAASGRPGMALLVVGKAPVPGEVKTRLCPPAVPEQAARIAAASLSLTVRAVRRVPGTTPVVALSGRLDRAVDGVRLRAQLSGVRVIAQRGKDFGHRLAAAHADVFATCGGLPVFQIGADTPQVGPELLAESTAMLARFDAVLGPAADGGWWALGLRDARHAEVLRTVPTSRPDTGERTLSRLRDKGLRVGLLATLSDVDTMADAQAVADSLPATEFAAAVAEVTKWVPVAE